VFHRGQTRETPVCFTGEKHVKQLDPETEARLGAVGARFALSADQIAALARLLILLAEDPTAPTTVTDPRTAVDAHVADSLVALELEPVRSATRIADLGAGAGFPGIPLAIALPSARVALVESVGRKAEFLARAVTATGARNVDVVIDRAESWRDGLEACDVVTARALARLNALVEYAAPLLRLGGCLVAFKGRRDPDEERDGAAAAAHLGVELVEVRRVDPFPQAEARHLVVYRKAAPTPPGYPRRPGMARKRPIR
jgi:16S rRNA (guanine527-N7)-methyltransferase